MITCLHGFASAPSAWDGTLAELPCAVPVERPALGGHGRPAAPVPASFEAEVDRLAERITQPTHLVGYSLGARVALGIALRHPQRVERLTLISCHPGLEERERNDRQASDAALARLLEERGMSAFVSHWEALPIFATQRGLPATVRGPQRARRLAHESACLAGALRGLGLAHMPDYRSQLPSLRAPVALVAGSLDPKFLALAHSMARVIPKATVVVLEGVGHDPTLEAPHLLSPLLHTPTTRSLPCTQNPSTLAPHHAR